MKEYYSVERNVQIVIALLKANNIKKIVASPGTTNIPLYVVPKMIPILKCTHVLMNVQRHIWPVDFQQNQESQLY